MKTICMKVAIVWMALLMSTILGGTGFAYVTTAVRVPEEETPWLRVATLSSLPEDGEPVLLPVRQPERDAWAVLPDRLLGQVFVRRIPGTDQVVVLHNGHQYAGSPRVSLNPIHYDKKASLFRARFWGLRFDLNGNEMKFEHGMGHEIRKVPAVSEAGLVWVRFKLWD